MNKLLSILSATLLGLTPGLTLANVGAGSGIVIKLDKADPAPLYTTTFPINYNYQQAKYDLKKGLENSGTGLSLSVMPFYNRASYGTSLSGNKNNNLYDLGGRCNLFALLGTQVPSGYSSTSPTALLLGTTNDYDNPNPTSTIPMDLIHAIAYGNGSTGGIPYTGGITPVQFKTIQGLVSMQNNPSQTPWSEVFGFLTIPAKYRKYGARFEVSAATNLGFGASLQIGVASINQTGSLDNAILFGNPVIQSVNGSTSTPPTVTSTTQQNVAYYLVDGVPSVVLNPFVNSTTTPTIMTDAQWYDALRAIKQNTTNQLSVITNTIGLNTSDFQKTGFEDLRGEIFWRKAIKLDSEEPVLFVPFISMFGSVDLGNIADPNQFFAMPLGSNGHKSIGGGAGFTLDFSDSFELAAAIGGMSYTSRLEQNVRMPNNENQAVIFPYTTAATIHPGPSWYVSLLMNSYHFDDDISFFMQYLYVGHSKDKYVLINEDPAFLPQVLSERSVWNSQIANLGLNYDVSSSVSIGCAAQIPLKQVNAYHSSTVSVSLVLSY